MIQVQTHHLSIENRCNKFWHKSKWKEINNHSIISSGKEILLSKGLEITCVTNERSGNYMCYKWKIWKLHVLQMKIEGSDLKCKAANKWLNHRERLGIKMVPYIPLLFLVNIFTVGSFIFETYLTVVNLVQLGISVRC